MTIQKPSVEAVGVAVAALEKMLALDPELLLRSRLRGGYEER